MGEKIIRPDRRYGERRQGRLAALGDAVEKRDWSDRRVYCWNLEPECNEARRRGCAAHFVQRNCWDLWATEYFPPGRKPCCHPDLDCSDCPVAQAKFGSTVSVYVPVPSSIQQSAADGPHEKSTGFCPSLFRVKGASAGTDDDSKPAFRCRRRSGIALHHSYVSEVCGSREYRECIFYEE